MVEMDQVTKSEAVEVEGGFAILHFNLNGILRFQANLNIGKLEWAPIGRRSTVQKFVKNKKERKKERMNKT